MGIFDFFKDKKADSYKSFGSSADGFVSTFIISYALYEYDLDEAGFNDRQKNIFKTAIILGILDAIAQSQNNLAGNNDIGQDIVVTELMLILRRAFELSESETREVYNLVLKNWCNCVKNSKQLKKVCFFREAQHCFQFSEKLVLFCQKQA